ncbi:glucoamylase glam [Dichotomocladium elegans]|nr:glucoamylase glam [Dichotomocladium elegans]
MKLNSVWKAFSILLMATMAFAATVPKTQVKLEAYTYSDSIFSGRIFVQNIDYTKIVTVYWSDASNKWDSSKYYTEAAYTHSIPGTNYEYWDFSATIGPSGIKQFYISYQVRGVTYYDNNGGYGVNYDVISSPPTTSDATTIPTTTTSAIPSSTTTIPASTGVPSGNSTITVWADSQHKISWKAMLANINPPGSATGFIAASLSTSGPDYYYAWTRDAAMVAHVIVNAYNTTKAGDATTLGVLKDFVTFQIKAMATSTVCNCLGEPKFNPDGSSYTGPWGRPQNDGPAERATTFILFADSYLSQTGDAAYVTTLKRAIFTDLDYVVTTWQDNCFDLWEEVNGLHMYTLAVMRRSLVDGASFAARNGDNTRASTYTNTAKSIETKLASFYNSSSNYVVVTKNFAGGVNKAGLDTSTLIAANTAGLGDGFFTPGSPEILATAAAIEKSFADLYGINKQIPNWLGTAIGRYPEDTYNGNGNSQGNPWFICTATFAELYYRAILEWQHAGSVTVNNVNLPFFKKFDSSTSSGTTYTVGTSSFDSLISKVAYAADNFFSTIKYHAATNGSMSEQFNRDTGFMTGARDLTWSHAAFITAAKAKAGTPVY